MQRLRSYNSGHLSSHSALSSYELFGDSLFLYDFWSSFWRIFRFMRIHAFPPNPLTSKGVRQSTTTAMRKRPGKSTNGRCGPSVPIFLHLNIESVSARKICVVSRLATRYKTLAILLQEIHGTNADQLEISHFMPAGLVSSKNLDLAAFVRENLSWAVTNRFPNEQLSGCVRTLIVGRSSMSPNLQPPDQY